MTHIPRGSQGFTMIEMMVVLAIIGLIAAMAIPSISSYFQVSLASSARDLASTVKETYNATVITGQVHRIVYDLKENSYWVESGPPDVLLDTKESLERESRKRRINKDEQKKEAPAFQMDKTVTRKKLSLPSGAAFEDVKTQQSEEPITDGQAYTHFFPHGMIEETIIHLKDASKHHVSLVLSPIVGHTDLYERYITEKEAFSGGK